VYLEIQKYLNKPIVPLALGILVLLLAILKIAFTIKAIYAVEKPSVSIQPIIEKKQVVDNKPVTTPLFGEFVPNYLKATDVKESTLNLQVVGVLYSPNEKIAQVIIRTASGVEHTYKIGDTLSGGAVIKRITPDGVLVNHDGVLEACRKMI
jgi:general secretion pathway protein C